MLAYYFLHAIALFFMNIFITEGKQLAPGWGTISRSERSDIYFYRPPSACMGMEHYTCFFDDFAYTEQWMYLDLIHID